MKQKGEVRRSLTFTVFTTSVIINTIACVVVDVTTSTDHTCTKMLTRIIGNTDMDCFTTTTRVIRSISRRTGQATSCNKFTHVYQTINCIIICMQLSYNTLNSVYIYVSVFLDNYNDTYTNYSVVRQIHQHSHRYSHHSHHCQSDRLPH